MMQFDQQLGDCQTKPCSLGFLVCGGRAIERLEDLVHIFRGDAGPDIAHGDPDFIGGYSHDDQIDDRIHRCEFHCIVE